MGEPAPNPYDEVLANDPELQQAMWLHKDITTFTYRTATASQTDNVVQQRAQGAPRRISQRLAPGQIMLSRPAGFLGFDRAAIQRQIDSSVFNQAFPLDCPLLDADTEALGKFFATALEEVAKEGGYQAQYAAKGGSTAAEVPNPVDGQADAGKEAHTGEQQAEKAKEPNTGEEQAEKGKEATTGKEQVEKGKNAHGDGSKAGTTKETEEQREARQNAIMLEHMDKYDM